MTNRTGILSLLLLATLTAPVFAQSTEMQFILMRSGKIIEGTVDQNGKDSKITLSQGGYFVIASERIEKTFRAKRDVVNYKIAVTPLKTKPQDQLFYWLLREEALEAAKKHLAYLKDFPNELSSFDYQSWHLLIQKKTHRQNQNTPQQFVTKSRVFTNRIEKHLVNGCAISGCHRANSSVEYKLTDNLFGNEKGAVSNYQSTQNVIGKIGKRHFLEFVSGKHANLKRGIYPTATSEYRAIATWVNSLKHATVSIQPKVSEKSDDIRAIAPKRIPDLNAKKPSGADRTNQYQPKSRTVLADSDEFTPRDEFDPEIFNRNQRLKWKQVIGRPASPIAVEPSKAPQRLISSDKTRTRN